MKHDQLIYAPPMIIDFGSLEDRTQENAVRDGIGRGKTWSFEADNQTPNY
jgi:hypothetical protein